MLCEKLSDSIRALWLDAYPPMLPTPYMLAQSSPFMLYSWLSRSKLLSLTYQALGSSIGIAGTCLLTCCNGLQHKWLAPGERRVVPVSAYTQQPSGSVKIPPKNN